MFLAATVRKSTEEEVLEVLPVCSDEFSNLYTNTIICTLHLIMLKKKIKTRKLKD
jgi:hypothetical protein